MFSSVVWDGGEACIALPWQCLDLTRQRLRGLNVFELTRLVATGQKNHDFETSLREVHPKAWPVMNPHLTNAFTHRFVISEISILRPIDTRLDSTGCLFVSQGFEPPIKNFGGVDRLHGSM